MAYSKQSWTDGTSGGTPVSAARLAHMEDGIGAALTPDQLDTTPLTPADLGLVTPAAVRAVSGAGQSVGNGTYPVYLDLTATDFNDDGTLFTVDVTNNKVTVASSGLYVASWGVGFTPTASTTQETYLTKNGGNALAAASAGNTGQANGSWPIRLLAGDYMQVICFVQGAAITLATATYRNWLALHRIGL